ncbi:MAG: CHASE domain-containing protein [Planctomycetes bacterium]|nr:CHASE domain-containing protein [Planctomycetota bacterium]
MATHRYLNSRRDRWLLSGIIGAALVASAWVWWTANRVDRHQDEARFERRIEELSGRISALLRVYSAHINGVQGLFAASRSVESDEWDTFFDTMAMGNRYPGLLDRMYCQRETPASLADLRSRLQTSGVSAADIDNICGRRFDSSAVDYFPVIYDHPHDGRVIGHDIAADPACAGSIALARDTGQIWLSAPLSLSRDANPQPAFRLIAPIYRNGRPRLTLDQRRAAFIAVVVCNFRIRDLLEDVVEKDSNDIDIEMVDTDLSGREILLYDRRTDIAARDSACPAWYHRRMTLPFGGRAWRIDFASTPEFESAATHDRARWATACGIAGGLLMILLAWDTLQGRQRARQQAEGMASSLRRSEAEVSKLALVAAKTDNGVIITDASGLIEWVNDGFLRMTGYDQAEVVGRKPGALLQGPDSDDSQISMMRARLGAHKPFTAELVNYRKDRSQYWVVIEAQPIFDAAGVLVNYIAIERDVTERTEVHHQLRRSYEETESLLSSISAVLISVQDDDQIVRWNQAAERLFARDMDQVIGRTLSQCEVPWDLAGIMDILARCRNTDAALPAHDVRYWRANGSEGVIEMGCSVTRNDRGERLITLVGLDVTDRRVLQSHHNQAMKLESIGQLAAGVAHEINTPTQFVGDNLHFLAESFAALTSVLAGRGRLIDAIRAGPVSAEQVAAADASAQAADLDYLTEEIPKAIQQSLEGMRRVGDIVGALKSFSHPDSDGRQSVDLSKALQSTLVVARNEYKYVADVVTDFQPDLALVACLPGEINQVFLNLIVNAAQAISDAVHGTDRRGTITVSTRSRADDWVEVRIGDTGTGIPDGVRERIFDPFFTTKEVGRGTGQGLYIARDIIVSKHAGSLTFETELGVGTTFIVRLPIATPDNADGKRLSSLHLAVKAPAPSST